jgi:hypothetical protein
MDFCSVKAFSAFLWHRANQVRTLNDRDVMLQLLLRQPVVTPAATNQQVSQDGSPTPSTSSSAAAFASCPGAVCTMSSRLITYRRRLHAQRS